MKMSNSRKRLVRGDLQVTGRIIAKNIRLYDEQFVSRRFFEQSIESLEERISQLEKLITPEPIKE